LNHSIIKASRVHYRTSYKIACVPIFDRSMAPTIQ